MKVISFGSLGTCAAVAAVSIGIALIGSTVKAQSQWGANGSQSVANAKKVPPPPPPPPLQLAASWVGTIQDSQQGAGIISLTFAEKKGSKTKSTLKGNWTISFPPGAPGGTTNDAGTQTGSVTATAVALTFHAIKADKLFPCKLIFSSVSATEEAISATYRFTGCKETNTGTITIAPGPQPTTVPVEIGDDLFSPNKVTIAKGQTVIWSNNGGERHSVNSNPSLEKCGPTSSENFQSPMLDPGDTFEHTFNSSGTFAYHCEVHGCPMKGTITVQ